MVVGVPSYRYGLTFAHILAFPSKFGLSQDQINERWLARGLSSLLGIQSSFLLNVQT